MLARRPMELSRRSVLKSAASTLPLLALRHAWPAAAPLPPLQQFSHTEVAVTGALQTAQRDNVTSVLQSLQDDSLLQPFRQMAGQPAPGASLGGWYEFKPDYDHHHDDAGLSPGSTLGQWISAFSRLYAASTFPGQTPRPELQARAQRLTALLATAISPGYFAQTRFPAYSLEKLACGMVDAHALAADPSAFSTLDQILSAAEPSLPGHAIDREIQWKLGADISWMWDESYTLPENFYLAAAAGGSPRFRRFAETYLLDQTWFEPLSRNVNRLGDKHAYSYVNSLNSAMQAYLVGGSAMHLEAARNAFAMLEAQSFATGGWGPEELLRKPGTDELAKSLSASHNSFETPCGGYAHMKLTRSLLRATRDGRYGDSMERIFYNTVLGALPLQPDGRSFYNSDYSVLARRVYSVHRWPCCSGTLPQVVADYGINTYLHTPGELWVNLYQPSEVRFQIHGEGFSLTQTTTYPEDPEIHLRLAGFRPASFTLRLRIPAWTGGAATLQVNRHAVALAVESGFASVTRLWRPGDEVTLTLPLSLRLEPLPANGGPAHLASVALLRGPLVLFALREPAEAGPVPTPLSIPRDTLLNAQRSGPREWTVATSAGPRRFVAFTDIGDRTYSTYLIATG